MHKRRTSHRVWLILASALPVFALAAWAPAQYPVGGEGHALDASNRLGSGGSNDSLQPQGPKLTGNDIVYGNVTGGREFHGYVPYRDPRAFTGYSPEAGLDQFIAGSSGVPQGNSAPANLTIPQPFFGQARQVPPPPGFVSEGYTGTYVPAPPKAPQPEDSRLNVLPDPELTALPLPGELMLPGPVDTSAQQTIITASPLYGIRQWQPTQPSDLDFLRNYTNLRPELNPEQAQLDQANIRRMQVELLATGANTQPPPAGQNQAAPQSPGLIAGQDLTSPPEAPDNQPLASGSLSSGPMQVSPLSGDMVTDQRTHQVLQLPSPSVQSTQYAELVYRLQQYKKQAQQKITDQEANRLYRAQVHAIEQANAAAAPKSAPLSTQPSAAENTAGKSGAQALGLPDYGTQAQKKLREPINPQPLAVPSPLGAPNLPPAAALTGPKPLQVHSLADGIKAKGLAQTLTHAEDLMRQGKYSSAIEQYELAERVAPNNKLLMLGRANAELGAGYYVRAEADLSDAFLSSEPLLMGQYDLRNWFGPDRLTYVIKDLKALAHHDQASTRPLILLAYIAYNTDNEPRAGGYLDLADKRPGAPTRLIAAMRQHWWLPSSTPMDTLAPTSQATPNK